MEKKFLEQNDILKMELNHEKGKVNRLELDKIEMLKTINKLEKQILNLQMKMKDYEIYDYVNKAKELSAADSVRKEAHAKFVKELKEKYNITSNWGFDPDSGEIKEDE